jgi:hypothetical protein
MNKLKIVCVMIFLSTFCFSQKKKEIKKAGIKSISITETHGNKTITDSKLFYDSNGNILEEINHDKEGALKSITKYKYNSSGDIIEETEYDEKNILKEKRLTKYNNLGEKIEELILDKDNKQLKKNIITYDSKGFKTERKTYDANNVLVSTKKYSYSFK